MMLTRKQQKVHDHLQKYSKHYFSAFDIGRIALGQPHCYAVDVAEPVCDELVAIGLAKRDGRRMYKTTKPLVEKE
jgi:hypothetical protein